MCCAKTSDSDQMSSLVNILLKQRDFHDENTFETGPGDVNKKFLFTPVSAHKLLYPSRKTKGDSPHFNGNMHLIFHPYENDKFEHIRGVRINKNRMIIKWPGRYLVYSSIAYGVDLRGSKHCSHLKYQTWKHYVRREVNEPKGNVILMTGVTQCCENCTYHASTSYTAGVFLLERGDRLYVEVSGSGLVVDEDSASFMGVAMLGNTPSRKTNKTITQAPLRKRRTLEARV
ncbi:hypothetical protein RRG08_042895 [Elysia crispata]|uniref:THD domain-containing protein n=1 Tax=Elysia crispata TaxID=231223 RepID=A0AAE1AVD2_9GAST|nr:hypothetical protein RRG08_042895 [Elysia crispata]